MKGGSTNTFTAAFLPTIVNVRHGNIFQNSINQTIMTNPNEPATPVTAGNIVHSIGLTKREYMATKIMAAMMATENFDTDFKNVARMAVEATEDLINELNKEEQS